MKTCNACNGTGMKVNSNDISLDNSLILFEREECKVCNGTGKLTDSYHAWYVQMLDIIERSIYCECDPS